MFRKTTLKLTAIYLGIMMAISLSFSISLYQVSVRELDRGLRQQGQLLFERPRIRNLFADTTFIINSRQESFDLARERIIANLIAANLAILFGGGLLSYYLARRSLKPIEEAHDAQSRFTADASHELRTPIAAMQTETEVALLDPNLDLDQAKDQLKSNLEELEKLAALSDGLLKLARLENSQLQKQEYQLEDVIKSAINRVALRADNQKVKIIFNNTKKIKIKADGNLIEDALVTLLDNAIKYSPAKSDVQVLCSVTAKNAIIKIRDSGPGIDSKDLPHVFERFYRADSNRCKNNTCGYGLGLAIAKNIIDMHNGFIKITSKKNHGTIVTIGLPTNS